MCGITGYWDFSPRSSNNLSANISAMTDSISHRGPDAGNYWIDGQFGIAIGQRRLAIIDLSANGAQPMHKQGKSLVYNGEIYNFREMRSELEERGCTFKGSSDTEVLLNGFVEWGVEQTIEKSIGMFTFALWDQRDKTLTLGRDRLGIKPLYWSFENDILLFGSELKALCAHDRFEKEIDLNALGSYFRYNYIPAPYSIYKSAKKLEQGHFLIINSDRTLEKCAYWTLDNVRANGSKERFEGSDVTAVNKLEELLKDAVSKRMIADVSLGAFLSGGIDSSTVVSLMQTLSDKPVKTFSVGFDTPGYNEAEYAKAIASHIGTEHTELYLSGQEAQNVIPLLPKIFDEPFSDSSQIPTYLVSKMTREHVTVALSGDGGDEMFAGYTRYMMTEQLSKKIFSIPAPLRKFGAKTISVMPAGFWELSNKLAPRRLKMSNPSNKASKAATILKGNQSDLYRTLISHWESPSNIVIGAHEYLGPAWDDTLNTKIEDDIERMQYIDAITYLPDDILTKVDRSSMAVALEARVPLIDHRVVEFAFSLPMEFKIRNGQSKWLLRQVLHKYVPQNLVDRPKMGFGIPLSDWLRGPLRDWSESLLDQDRLREQGILNPLVIREKWHEHLSGQKDWGYHLWDVLMFQAWHDEWMK